MFGTTKKKQEQKRKEKNLKYHDSGKYQEKGNFRIGDLTHNFHFYRNGKTTEKDKPDNNRELSSTGGRRFPNIL